jgi:hypothetical protein
MPARQISEPGPGASQLVFLDTYRKVNLLRNVYIYLRRTTLFQIVGNAAVLGVPMGLLDVYNNHRCRHKHVYYCYYRTAGYRPHPFRWLPAPKKTNQEGDEET